LQVKEEVLPAKPSERTGVLLSTSAPGSKGPLYADFKPDVFDEHAEVFIGDKLFLLYMVESRTGEQGFGMPRDGYYHGEYKVCFGEGLVLRRAVNDSDAYERVGMFRYTGTMQWEGWRKVRTEETICII
jgi:hypothetical protein